MHKQVGGLKVRDENAANTVNRKNNSVFDELKVDENVMPSQHCETQSCNNAKARDREPPTRGTQFTIKDGVVRAPLGIRSSNVIDAASHTTKDKCSINAASTICVVQSNEKMCLPSTNLQHQIFNKRRRIANFEVYNDRYSEKTPSHLSSSVDESMSLCSSNFESGEKSSSINVDSSTNSSATVSHGENALSKLAFTNNGTSSAANNDSAEKMVVSTKNTPQNRSAISRAEIYELYHNEEVDDDDCASSQLPTSSFVSSAESVNSLYSTSGEYSMDIYKYQCWRESQNIGRPRRLNFLAKQPEVNEENRAVLVDWMVDVCLEYDLSLTTFFVSVSLVDRTLARVACPRDQLQLLGVTSVFLAAKMEEVYPPTLTDVVGITDHTYTGDQILKMESVILQMVKFQLSPPLVDTFANFFLFYHPISPKAACLMWYLLELSSISYACVSYKPSIIASAAYAIASYVIRVEDTVDPKHDDECETKNNEKDAREECWPSALAEKTGISREEFEDVALILVSLYYEIKDDRRGLLQAMFNKYSATANFEVSNSVDVKCYLNTPLL